MNPQDLSRYKQAILNAQSAIQRKSFFEARQWALSASQIAPEREEPWLLLAAISEPTESISYLQRALSINPTSERAARGMQWALSRLAQTPIEEPPQAAPPPADTQPILVRAVPAPAAAEKEPVPQTVVEPEAVDQLRSPAAPAKVPVGRKPSRKTPAKKKKATSKWLFILLIVVLVLMIAVVVWMALPAWLALARSAAAPIPGDMLIKPSLTPTATATFTPTPTSTPTPTPTETPTPTSTFTPEPTNTPVPPTAVSNAPSAPIDAEGRWIDIDLSAQMLYAYDGDEVVNSFLVSTGTYYHPTVTGQYYIYVKYRYTDMRGADYYLPDVPYTMYFYEGYGIHGTYWHNNFGTPMSHGCVNMRTSEAEWLFYWASVGTLVNVHY